MKTNGIFILIFLSQIIYAQKDTIAYYENGRVKFIGKVLNDKKVGKWTYYLVDNTLDREIYYLNEKKSEKKYFPKGNKLDSIVSIFIKSDPITLSTNYHYLGYVYESLDSLKNNIAVTYEFDDNYQTGKEIEYYSDGSTIIKNFLNGRLYGTWEHYFEGKQLFVKGNFENNVRIGEWYIYHRNGTLRASGNYYPDMNSYSYEGNNVLIHGKSYEIKDTFKLFSEKYYKYFKTVNSSKTYSYPSVEYFKDGLWQYWNENGKLEKEELYNKGILLNIKDY